MEASRPLGEQVARHAEEYVQDRLFDLQAPEEPQGEPEWLQHIEIPVETSPAEVRFRHLLGGIASAGLIDGPGDYARMLQSWQEDHYGRRQA